MAGTAARQGAPRHAGQGGRLSAAGIATRASHFAAQSRDSLPLSNLQSVQRPKLLARVVDPWCRRETLACGALHQFVRRELAPMPVYVLPKPTEQAGKLTALDVKVQFRHLGSDLFHQLRPDEVAERVAGEPGEADARPVHVLQHALAIVRHVDPQV